MRKGLYTHNIKKKSRHLCSIYQKVSLRAKPRSLSACPTKPASYDALPLLGIIAASIHFPGFERRTRVPMIVWGKYYDQDGHLQAIDCLSIVARPSQNIGSLSFVGGDSQKIGGAFEGCAIKLNQLYYFADLKAANISYIGRTLDARFLPDMILRRVHCAINDKRTVQDTGFFEPSDHLKREGVIFPNIAIKDLVNDTFIPEVWDAPIERALGREMMDPAEIAGICAIAVNYTKYCRFNAMPIVFPEAGLWPNWPADFLSFADPQHPVDTFRYCDSRGCFKSAELPRPAIQRPFPHAG